MKANRGACEALAMNHHEALGPVVFGFILREDTLTWFVTTDYRSLIADII
jgi:hypothetical protein